MNLFHFYQTRVRAALERLIEQGQLPSDLDLNRVMVEPPKDASLGDISTNAAMVFAKPVQKPPRLLAEMIVAELKKDDHIQSVEIAGPGFINIRVPDATVSQVIGAIFKLGGDYGRAIDGNGDAVNVEYVSANPTGPMHVGHGRGAVFGDALSALLAFAGFKVTREYYINDAGAQVDVLARSAYLRYREALGEDIGAIPEGLYPGDYLVPVGEKLASNFEHRLKDMPESEWLPKVRQYAVEAMLVLILKDLAALGISFDVFFSEKALVERISKFQRANEPPIFYCGLDSFDLMHGPVGGVRHYFAEIDIEQAKLEDKAPISKVFKAPLVEGTLGEGDLIAKTIADLRARNLVYEGVLPPPKGQIDADWEEREQTLFRATAYGDDTDRPLLKSDGSYTYFAADMAYHKSKFDRGFKQMIDVWGADHGGYVTRMQAAVKALTQGEGQLDVKLCQLVRLMRNSEPVKMSKRAGDFVTLREVIDEVGRDAVRFMMLFRKNDATLDFDLVKVREQSKENPVFYVQYAYARCCSIFRQAEEQGVFPSNQPDGDLEIYFPFLENDDSSPAAYTHEADKQLILLLAQFPRLIESAAEAHEPHRIAFYLYDLASAFHAHWNKGKDETSLRFVHPDNHNLTLHRLALVESVRTVLQTGLSLLGVSSPEEMR